jgi:DNA repair protein RecN (Recombination protein N)
MLRELKIANLALIESLHLVFGEGLSVFTGETGAGKSIILQAIGLLAGARAPASLVRSGSESASVEAYFDINPDRSRLAALLAGMGLTLEEDGLFIKRILSDQGRSRYYINGAMATAKMTGELCAHLLVVAGQHDHRQLLSSRNHLDIIDTVANHWPQRLGFTALHHTWRQTGERLETLRHLARDQDQQRDFLAFQIGEIKDAAVMAGEDEELALERQRLKSSETLIKLGHATHQLLAGDLFDSLAQAKKNLEQIASLDQSAEKLQDQVVDAYYQLGDLAEQLRDYCQNLPDDPSRLEAVEERIDLLLRLKRKYAPMGGGLGEVLTQAERLKRDLTSLDSMEQQLHDLEREMSGLEKRLFDLAASLSAARQQTATRLQEAMHRELASLCIEDACFRIHFADKEKTLQELNETGWDRPEFLFSANAGEPVKPLAQIASGGELSRLTLALKCLLARQDEVDCVIFDEVDSGIGGRTAEAVAAKIRELAGHHQVLCITHLPQIASHGDHHFLVEKEVSDDGRTRTSITLLAQGTRVKELARMLAGKSITSQTLAYAEELIERRQ